MVYFTFAEMLWFGLNNISLAWPINVTRLLHLTYSYSGKAKYLTQVQVDENHVHHINEYKETINALICILATLILLKVLHLCKLNTDIYKYCALFRNVQKRKCIEAYWIFLVIFRFCPVRRIAEYYSNVCSAKRRASIVINQLRKAL